MPITTARLIIRPTEVSDGKMINDAIIGSYDDLHQFMEWADHIPSLEESEKYAKEAAQNWVD